MIRALLPLLFCISLFAADGLPVADVKRSEPINFASEVFPMLNKNCLPCHNSTKAKSKLNMETPQLMMEGSENGPVIVPGNGAESFLFIVAAHQDDPDLNMPPEKNKANAVNLTAEELGLLKLWIDQGAKGLAPSQINRPLEWQPVAEKVQPIYAVDLDPTGRYAVCGRGNDVAIYHVAQGTEEARLTDAHRDLVQAVAISRDHRLATAGFKQVKIWEPTALQSRQDIHLPAPATHAASQRDSAVFADAQGHVAYWQIEGQAQLNWKKIHNGAVTALQLLPGKGQVLTASADQTLRLLEQGSLTEQWKLEPGFPITAALVINKEKQVALAGPFNEIKIYDLTTTNTQAVASLSGHSQPVSQLLPHATQSGQFFAADRSGHVIHWQLEGAKKIRAINTGAPIEQLSLSADGARLCTTHKDRPAKLWRTDNGQLVKDLSGNLKYTWNQNARTRDQIIAQKRKTHFENKHKAAVKKLEEETKKLAQAEEALPKIQEDANAKIKIETEKKPAKEQAEALVKQREEEQAKELKAKKAVVKSAGEAYETLKAEADAIMPQAEEARKAKDQLVQQKQQELNAANERVKSKEAEQAGDLEQARNEVKKNQDALEQVKKERATIVPEAQKTKAEKDKLVQAKQKERDEATRIVQQLEKGDGKPLADAKNAAKKPIQEFEAANKTADEARGSLKSAQFNLEAAKRIKTRSEEGLAQAKVIQEGSDRQLAESNTRLEAARKAVGEYKPQPVGATFIGERVLIAEKDRALLSWGKDGAAVDAQTFSEDITLLQNHGDKGMFIGTADKRIRLVDTRRTWEAGRTFTNFADRVTAIDFSPDGQWLATGSGEPSRSGRLQIWNIADGARVLDLPDAHGDTLTALAFSPDGQHIATASPDRLVKIWSLPKGELVRTLEGHTDYVLGVAWRADGLELASSGADKVAKRWQFEDGKQVQTYKEYDQEVTAVSYLGTESNIITASGDKSVRLDNNRLEKVTAFMHTATTSENGKFIAAGGQDGVLKIWSKDRKLVHEFGP